MCATLLFDAIRAIERANGEKLKGRHRAGLQCLAGFRGIIPTSKLRLGVEMVWDEVAVVACLGTQFSLEF